MAVTDSADTRKVAATGTNIEENFENLCTGVVLVSDGDLFVDFDKPADTGSLLVKANQAPTYIPIAFTRLNVITSGGSANLYVVGVRGDR